MRFSSKEAEEAVLGVLLLYGNTYYKYSDELHDELFFDPFYCWIFKMLKLTAVESKIDILTVSQKAMDNASTIPKVYESLSIPAEISTLTSKIISDHAFEDYIAILKELYSRRKLYRAAKDVTDGMEREGFDMDEAVRKLTGELLDVSGGKDDKERDALGCIELFEQEQSKSFEDMVLQTDISEVDEIIGGFEYSDLVIVAGAASMGKTSMAIKLLKNFILKKKKVGVVSLEMNDIQLMYRLLSNMTDVPFKRIKYKDYDDIEKVKVRGAVEKLRDTQFFLDSKSSELSQVLNRIKKWKIRYGLDVVIIDYLQLIKCIGKGNREQEVATIARSLKNIAKELDIVVVALSQLSRAVSNREDKRPTLSDLRESGEIEQAADTVMFCFRQAYYDDIGDTSVQDAEVIIAKGRNVGTGVARVEFHPPLTKWISSGDRQETYPIPESQQSLL